MSTQNKIKHTKKLFLPPPTFVTHTTNVFLRSSDVLMLIVETAFRATLKETSFKRLVVKESNMRFKVHISSVKDPQEIDCGLYHVHFLIESAC